MTQGGEAEHTQRAVQQAVRVADEAVSEQTGRLGGP